MKTPEIDAGDLLTALQNQRNSALQEAAMNWALCLKYERRVAELEKENEELRKTPADGSSA